MFSMSNARAGSAPNLPETYDVIVVGAGFAGLYALHRLRSAGFSVLVVEAASGVGGTWFWNRYPGARCDVESIDYSYSFDEQLQQDWVWTERFAAHAEILSYLDHVADRFDLRRGIRLETQVVSAHFQPGTDDWLLRTAAGSELRATFCIMATGALSSVKPPDFDGLADFTGQWHHSARWPAAGVDMAGMRVAVIGTGSTGVQIIPVVAREAAHVTVLQRTPNYSVPARNRPLGEGELDAVKANYADRRARGRVSASGVPLDFVPGSGKGVRDAERRARYDVGWAAGGVLGLLRAYTDYIVDPEVNESLAQYVRDKIAATVTDPATAERLTPHGYPIGAKRLCVDSSYFETYNRDNVTLIDINEDPIVRVTVNGIETANGHVDADVIVFAIGFDAITGAVRQIDVRGRDGEPLNDHWHDGPKAYLGLAVAGFPNLFLVSGPGSPAVLGNAVAFIEQHVEFIDAVLQRLRDQGMRTIEADPAAEEHWAKHVHDLAAQTLFPTVKSWFVGSNIDGKPPRFMPYAAGLHSYRTECDEVLDQDLRGFFLRA